MGDVQAVGQTDGPEIQSRIDTLRNDGTNHSEKTIYGDANVDQRSPEEQKVADVPPDGGYGWVCVASIFLLNGHTWGINSSYGIFLAYYLFHNTFPGATALEYALVGGLSISIALFVSPLATVSTAKFGTHTTLAVGIVLETAALLGASFATQIWHLFLSQGLCFGAGMGFLFVGSVGIIPQWFAKRRSFANSLGTAGSGMCALMYSLATNAMIQSIGIGWAFRILAILAFSVNTVCAILLRDRNKAVGARIVPFNPKLFRQSEYLLFLGWGIFSMLGYVILLFSLPSYATSIGLSASQGSIVGAMLNLAQGIGRPCVGYFSDSVGRINIALLCTFLSAVFCFVIWIPANSYGVLIFFALAGGTCAGVFWATVAPVGVEVIGLQDLPAALSMLWVILVVPATFAEPIGLELRTTTGNQYLHSQIFTGFMYIGAAICMWFIRAWKINELEQAGAVADKAKREAEIRNDDAVPVPERAVLQRSASTRSKAKAMKGLWTLVRV